MTTEELKAYLDRERAAERRECMGGILIAILVFAIAAWCPSVPAYADAPAPAPRAKATPRPAEVTEPPVPFDAPPIVEGAQTDPPSVEAVAESPVLPPAPRPSPTPGPLAKENARPFHVETQLGGVVTLTGEGTAVTPTFWVNADGPLAVGSTSLGRIGARMGLSSVPGEQFSAGDIKTYKAAKVALWGGPVVGKLGDVTTLVVLEGAFATKLNGSDGAPLDRLSRSLGLGVSFRATRSNASMTALVGYDEETASCPAVVACTGIHSGLTLMLYGQVPIAKGTLLLADVSLSAASRSEFLQRRDVLRLGLVVDPVEAVKAIRGK